MPRYALKIEYDGTPFHGWQRQQDRPSVQGRIEAALAKLGHADASVAGAGRTDAGVHALGQVAHVDLDREWEPFRLSEALNYHLRPDPVAVLALAQVTPDFHARFDAIERAYRFRILTGRRAPLTIEAHQFWRLNHPLNVDAMREGARHLLGRHDFTTFRSSLCQAKSPVKTLDQLDITAHPRADGCELRFTLRARSFLHNQVRSFVGTLERVGTGAWTPADVATALAARDRAACGPVSPPEGLYLTDVRYPQDPFAAD